MSKSITLDPKLGINPRLTKCIQCGETLPTLLLLGILNHKMVCTCGSIEYGGKSSDKCPKCKSSNTREKVKLIKGENIYTGEICDKCNNLNILTNKEVYENGGIFFKCTKCNSSGAIRKNEQTIDMRKLYSEKTKLDYNNPDPITNLYLPFGVEYPECPNCENGNT